MTDQPRIDPLAPGEWREDVGSILEAAREGTDVPLGSHNIFRTLARHPDLFRSWLRRRRVVSRLPSTSSVPPEMKPATSTRWNPDTSSFGLIGVSIGIS